MFDENHMIDLQSFIEIETEKIYNYYESKSSDSLSQKYLDPNWISEQILLLFSQWTTGITRPILRQDILNQAKTSRSRQHVKPDSTHHPVLHGTIQKVDIVKSLGGNPNNISSAVIHIKQDGYNLIIQAALHGALLPFIGKFITGGRQIHLANTRFSNDCLIPNQLCVIDLKRTSEDIDFVKKSSIMPLSKITDENYPDSLLLRVESPTKDGIMMSDCANSIEFYLEDERKLLKQLLNFGDVILLYKPWAQELEKGHYVLIFGPNSVIFRVPISVDSKLSQISQHAQTYLTQDGLSFRNSSACRSIRGTVSEVINYFEKNNRSENDKWTHSTLLINSTLGEKLTINVFTTSETPYEVLRVVKSLKANHFVWIFGLIEEDPTTLSFTAETTVYNTSQLYSIIASNVVLPRTLNICSNYKTFVARAEIVKVLKCEVHYRHKFCNTLLRSSNCPVCPTCQSNIYTPKEIDEDFLFELEIDDMSCDPVTVNGIGSKFSFWSTKPREWKSATEEKKEKLLASLIGRECVFVISVANEQEFCKFGDDFSAWRIDQCIRPESPTVGDIEREVHSLIKWHKKLDEQTSQSVF